MHDNSAHSIEDLVEKSFRKSRLHPIEEEEHKVVGPGSKKKKTQLMKAVESMYNLDEKGKPIRKQS